MIKRTLIVLACALCTSSYAADIGGYLFVTFRGEGSPMTEQIYFMLSENGRRWKGLNDEDPVLVSDLGEKGVRDPFIMRSHDNKKFYCIATDLSIHLNGDWGRAVNSGSKSLVIWESEDLVNWSEPRLCRVAPDEAGCTWAPEAVYDKDRGEYMVFWASMTSGKHIIWAARTKDFKEFGQPFIYIEKPTAVIDTTIIHDGDSYYRFTKDERDKAITMEQCKSIMGEWEEVDGFSLKHLQGYEGPTCFLMEPPKGGKDAKWCLLLDFYSQGKGYQSFETDDLGKGDFDEGDSMDFPFHPVRHGSVLTLTREEVSRIKQADRNDKFTVGGEPIND